ncbi:MAG: hypothetical protein IT416_03775 [Candidatus Pacebacteria bacterium]|nr:hypothetical protein [Candidatus Paceibacterota bacterium]
MATKKFKSVGLMEFNDKVLPAIFTRPSDFVSALKVMPKDHPADHVFKHGAVNGICYECGFIQADVPTTCKCGRDLRWHAEHRIAPAYDAEAGMLTDMGVGDLMEGVPSLDKMGKLNLDEADALMVIMPEDGAE